MIEYDSAPESVRKLALIFLEAATYNPTERPGQVQLAALVLLGMGKEGGLSAAELVEAVRWLARHYTVQVSKQSVIDGAVLKQIAAAWETYADEVEKLATSP